MDDFGFWIADFGLVASSPGARNPKSKIANRQSVVETVR
jgi:hypothetical protein